MPTIAHDVLQRFGVGIFQAAGVPQDQAEIVTDHLVEANLLGHDSHGIRRLPNYVSGLQKGSMRPLDDPEIVRETATTLVIDAKGGLGMVMAYRAMKMAVERAQRYTLGAVAVHQASHIGRLGAYPPLAAEQDCIGLIMLNGGARFTAPFGGTARRLPPNPIAIAVPTQDGPPMVLDITTSMVAGGKIDVYAERGQPVPEGVLIDPEGNPVTDPAAFRRGEATMLPLGGFLGHKGYGLGMMIDAMAGGLSWAGCSREQPTRGGSGFLAMAIKIDGFIDPDEYKREVQGMIDWVKSSPTAPGVDQIYVPGEIEERARRQREAQGLHLEDGVWQELVSIAQELGVSVPKIEE